MSFTIRKATTDDLEGIAALLEHGFHDAVPCFITENLLSKFSFPEYTSFVAVCDGNIVGHARVRTENGIAHFGMLTVHQDYRRQGIAQALTQARVHYLESHNFQGRAISDAITHHPYSQMQLSAVGFHPVRILPDYAPDQGFGPETTVGFVRVFSPAGLWKPEETTISLYLPQEYHTVATHILAPFGNIDFKESSVQTPGNGTRSFVSSEEMLKPRGIYPVRLYDPNAPANIALLRENEYIFSGIFPVITDGALSAAAQMYRVPDAALTRKKIRCIPAAAPLLDFVWEQYARTRMS
ncbi:GNAT family N-acetyltransferase [Candidatus Woesearchaeota archaeon]|nr:GNAT family N-acetyltransferase [Candidatus Woesearchaeota archaeon]